MANEQFESMEFVRENRIKLFTEGSLIKFLLEDKLDFLHPFLERMPSYEMKGEDISRARSNWKFGSGIKVHAKEFQPEIKTDIDIFCQNSSDLAASEGWQVKKIKVQSTPERDKTYGVLTKLISKAVTQSEKLLRLGFPYVSILLIVSNDSHEVNNGGIIWNQMRYETTDEICAKFLNLCESSTSNNLIGKYVLVLTENQEHKIYDQGAAIIRPLKYPEINPNFNIANMEKYSQSDKPFKSYFDLFNGYRISGFTSFG